MTRYMVMLYVLVAVAIAKQSTNVESQLTGMYTILSTNRGYLHTIFNYTRSVAWATEAVRLDLDRVSNDVERLDGVIANMATAQEKCVAHDKALETRILNIEDNLGTLADDNKAIQEALKFLVQQAESTSQISLIKFCVIVLTPIGGILLLVIGLLVYLTASGSPRSPITRAIIATVIETLTHSITSSDLGATSEVGVAPGSPPPYAAVPLSSLADLDTERSCAGTAQALV